MILFACWVHLEVVITCVMFSCLSVNALRYQGDLSQELDRNRDPEMNRIIGAFGKALEQKNQRGIAELDRMMTPFSECGQIECWAQYSVLEAGLHPMIQKAVNRHNGYALKAILAKGVSPDLEDFFGRTPWFEYERQYDRNKCADDVPKDIPACTELDKIRVLLQEAGAQPWTEVDDARLNQYRLNDDLNRVVMNGILDGSLQARFERGGDPTMLCRGGADVATSFIRDQQEEEFFEPMLAELKHLTAQYFPDYVFPDPPKDESAERVVELTGVSLEVARLALAEKGDMVEQAVGALLVNPEWVEVLKQKVNGHEVIMD